MFNFFGKKAKKGYNLVPLGMDKAIYQANLYNIFWYDANVGNSEN